MQADILNNRMQKIKKAQIMNFQAQQIIIITLSMVMLGACDMCPTPKELSLRPDSTSGKDATLWSCMSDANFGNDIDYEAMAWTWNSLGFPEGILRGLMEFDLSTVPDGAYINSASLSLYNNPGSSENNGEHASLSGSNTAVLQRIIEQWEEDQATWAKQPASTYKNEVYLSESTNPHQNYVNIDVTRLVQDMVDHPDESFGFLLKLETEECYRSMIFASSDHPDAELRPGLQVFYTEKE